MNEQATRRVMERLFDLSLSMDRIDSIGEPQAHSIAAAALKTAWVLPDGLVEKARDERYSDEWVGIAVRNWLRDGRPV